VVQEYYDKAGLWPDLEALGFHLVGYGCTTCIGNSGPLPEAISRGDPARRPGGGRGAVGQPQLRGAHQPDVKANYLASPPLVVAYALAGTVDIDFATEPIGHDQDGSRCSCATSGRRRRRSRRRSSSA
jgi:aconitate hydratase